MTKKPTKNRSFAQKKWNGIDLLKICKVRKMSLHFQLWLTIIMKLVFRQQFRPRTGFTMSRVILPYFCKMRRHSQIIVTVWLGMVLKYNGIMRFCFSSRDLFETLAKRRALPGYARDRGFGSSGFLKLMSVKKENYEAL